MKRSPLRRRTPLKAGTKRLRAKPVSDARRDAVAAVHARDRYCQAERLVPQVACGGPLDVHEVKPRSQGGDPTNPDHAILCCRRHHEWIGDYPREAHAVGLRKWSWE